MTTKIQGPEHRYAKALFELASESKADITPYLLTLHDAIEGSTNQNSTELSATLASPIVDKSAKLNILQALLKSSKAPSLLSDFIEVVVNKGRAELLCGMVECYLALDLADKNIVTAKVSTAVELTAPQKKAIAEFVLKANKTAQDVQLEEISDPSLIAGFKVQVGSVEYDTSVRGKLENLRTELNI